MDDQEYLSIMAELRFIGSVSEGDFLNITAGKVEPKNIVTCLTRQFWYRNEGGQTTAKYCKSVIVKALKLFDKYNQIDGCDQYVKSICKYINDAKTGMIHLKNTHSSNTLAFALFDSIIDCINSRIPTIM